MYRYLAEVTFETGPQMRRHQQNASCFCDSAEFAKFVELLREVAGRLSTESRLAASERLLTKEETTEIVGFSYTTIYEWMRRGTFPAAIDCEGTPRFRHSEVESWINSRPRRRYRSIEGATE